MVRSATSPSRRSLHTRSLPSTVSEFLAAHHRKLSDFSHPLGLLPSNRLSIVPASHGKTAAPRLASFKAVIWFTHRVQSSHVLGVLFRDLPGSLLEATRSTRLRCAPASRRDSFKLPHWEHALQVREHPSQPSSLAIPHISSVSPSLQAWPLRWTENFISIGRPLYITLPFYPFCWVVVPTGIVFGCYREVV